MKRIVCSVVRLVALLVCLGTSGFVAADPAPRIMARTHLEPAGPVVAGSEVKLVVDVLTTTWFTEAPNWPLFNLPDAIVSLPDEQAVNLSEDIDGTRWFGVSRAYRIAPRAGKTFDIAPLTITVYPGGMTGAAQVSTPALKLVATLPPGAEGMSTFFAAPQLSVEQKIAPAPRHLAVGAPLTRTITQRATATESMLIPPAPLGDVPGLKRYAKPAATRNIVEDRAGLVAGERTDSATYVADRSGTFNLPPVTIEWWNTTTRRKETVVLPAVRISAEAVREKPLFEIPVDAMLHGTSHRIVVIHASAAIAGGLIALGVVLLIAMRARAGSWVRYAAREVRDARTRWLASDALAWIRLASTARSGEWRRTIPALYSWMDRSRDFGRPARLDSIHAEVDADAATLLAAVESNYAGREARQPRWKEIRAVLRRSARRADRKQNDEALPGPLNRY